MKAAVLHQVGTYPKYDDLQDPIPANEEQALITVKASTIKQLDKSKASGQHYTTYPYFPIAVGVDGAGVMEDGIGVYAFGLTGMLAEKALINKTAAIKLPEGLDYEIAAALPNALLGSDAALVIRAQLQKGETVLINGATGVTGKMAVQTAKYRGAGRIIVTGRNAETLEELKALGADETISLKHANENVVNRVKQIQQETPIDIVIDYLWGQPMLNIMSGFAASKPHRVRIVLVGEMAGANIAMPSGYFRSTKMELLGSGIGSLSPQEIGGYFKNELPDMFQLAADGKLKIDLERVELKDIEQAWQMDAGAGKRIVVRI